MSWKTEWKIALGILAAFFAVFFLPEDSARFEQAVVESLYLARWYAREHVLLCLVPAFFIAGAVAVFISKASVVKYLGAGARKITAYGVAAVSGSILAVCSCTVLPLFASIYRMGAGLGPATAFLYSGPAINVLAIALTAQVLGVRLGIARAVGAILFSVVIGLIMQWLFRNEKTTALDDQVTFAEAKVIRPLWQNALFFFTLIAILVFANWGRPVQQAGLWHLVYLWKWPLTGLFSAGLALLLIRWFDTAWWKVLLAAAPVGMLCLLFPDRPVIPFAAGVLALGIITGTSKGECGSWFAWSWKFARQILPLLLAGVLAAGLLLGNPEGSGEGLIPSSLISRFVGGNSLAANLFASVVGAFMYFATLTEIPILQGLMHNGMGQGPALALLLAGPALSLPNMLVIRSVLGTQKTFVYVVLVVIMATFSGWMYGNLLSGPAVNPPTYQQAE